GLARSYQGEDTAGQPSHQQRQENREEAVEERGVLCLFGNEALEPLLLHLHFRYGRGDHSAVSNGESLCGVAARSHVRRHFDARLVKHSVADRYAVAVLRVESLADAQIHKSEGKSRLLFRVDGTAWRKLKEPEP